MAETIERKYTLVRVAKGDYLLPGNDGKTLWRIRTYEDGPSHGVESMPRDREFWGIWKWIGRPGQWNVAESDWDCWDLGMYEKREEAIQTVLRAESPRPTPPPRSDPRPLGAILLDSVATKT